MIGMPKIDLRASLGVEIGETYIRSCDLIALIISFISLFTAMCMKIRGVLSADFIGLTFIRKTLRCGEGYTDHFPLLLDGNPLDNRLYVFQVVVYTAMGGKKRLLIIYKRNNSIYYCDPLREWGIDFKTLEKKLEESFDSIQKDI